MVPTEGAPGASSRKDPVERQLKRSAIPAGRSQSAWRRLLGEPLVHFFAVGAIVFGAYWALNDAPEAMDSGQTIEITDNDVRQIVVAWLAQGRTPLTREQLLSLIDQKITEEVLFREGLALGLDRNDEIIKRRIAQKMDFLAADVAALQEPERAELVDWYSRNAERFAIPPRVSFRHLYFSPDKRGGSAHGDALATLAAIGETSPDSPELAVLADPFMLRSYYRNSSPEQMLKEFGPAFSAELFDLEPGGWHGPVQSGFGWHLVWIDSMEPGRVPDFDEIEVNIRSAWRDERYQDIKRAALEEMRSRYKVVVGPLDSIDMTDLLGRGEGRTDARESVAQ